MKKLLTILLLTSSLFSKSLDSYTIDLKQIETINHLGDEQIVIVLKDEYWESFFEFTRSHISQKTIVKLDNISVEPYIFSPLYHSLELSPVNPAKFSKELKELLHKSMSEKRELLEKKRESFLNKMLKKYPHDEFIISELIALYHAQETKTASEECIALYEKATDKIKEKIVKSDYQKVFDCYLDLNQTSKSLAYLIFVKSEIKENNLYEILELEAYVHTLEHQPERAKRVYVEALEVLKKTDFTKELVEPNKDIIEKVEAMKQTEVKHVEAIILDLEYQLSKKRKN